MPMHMLKIKCVEIMKLSDGTNHEISWIQIVQNCGSRQGKIDTFNGVGVRILHFRINPSAILTAIKTCTRKSLKIEEFRA